MRVPGSPESEIVFAIFLDIAGYSLLSLDEQFEISDSLKSIIRETCLKSDLSEMSLTIDTGDGAAIIFFGGSSLAIDCAVRLGLETKTRGIGVRIGVHCGPIFRVKDVNGRDSVVGPAINLAERVMQCADPGHVLLSAAAADATMATGRWNEFIEDIGLYQVKHKVTIRLFNLVTPECGRKELPTKLNAANMFSGQSSKNNFTEPERAFVGRHFELESLVQRIASRSDRLLTLTGSGGIGKSRLALEAAKLVEPEFADGAWVIACDELTSRADLVAQIAGTMKIELSEPSTKELARELADKQVLLLLDCFEGAISHGIVLEDLLKHGPEIQVIVTSRTLIGLPREQEIVVEPMSTQKTGNVLADAVTLFIEAAKASIPSFRINKNTRKMVEQIVQKIEGVPLAIILAAGRLRHLSLSELQDQIDSHPLSVLKRKSKENDRHADFARVVDDSFRLLPIALQSFLMALSVFRGGFWLEDVESIVMDYDSVLDGLSELRDNSLLTAHVIEDKMRYRALDVIAEYISSIADPKFLEPIRESHAYHFSKRARALRILYDAGRWSDANSNLTMDLGNFRRAIDYSLRTSNSNLIDELAGSLCRPLMEAGYRSDFEKLAQATSETSNLELLIETTGLRGGVLRRDQNFEGAERSWLERANYCRLAHATEMEADTYLDLADLALVREDQKKADEYLIQFAEIEPLLPECLVLASGQVTRAKAVLRNGDKESARNFASSAFELAKRLPSGTQGFYVWVTLADVFNQLEEFETAVRLCCSEIKQTIEGHHYSYTGLLLLKLATALEKQGKVSQCLTVLEIAQRIPKSLSLTLRQQIRDTRQKFIEKHGIELLKTAEVTNSDSDWQSSAKAFASKLLI